MNIVGPGDWWTVDRLASGCELGPLHASLQGVLTAFPWWLQVSSLLAGSGLLAKAHTIRSAANRLRQDLQPLVSIGQQQGLCPPDMFSRSDMQWAVGICLSRSVRLDDMTGEPIVLVPFADFLNHDVSCEAFLVWDDQQQAVVLRPDRSYRPGEQVGRGWAVPGGAVQALLTANMQAYGTIGMQAASCCNHVLKVATASTTQ